MILAIRARATRSIAVVVVGGRQRTTQPEAPADDVLGVRSRAWRVVVLAALTAVFVAGSVVGQDDWWPFSPWRMFSTSQAPTGAVIAMGLEVQTATDPTWVTAPVTPETVGLNRAEVEGRSGRIAADPSLLATLAASHTRLRPSAPAWTAVRLVRHETVVVDRRPTGVVRTTEIARWARP